MTRVEFREAVDQKRLTVMVLLAWNALKKGEEVPNYKKHLWFFDDRLDHYELREGNAPSDSERPDYLKSLDLWINPSELPKDILKELVPGGRFEKLLEKEVSQLQKNEYPSLLWLPRHRKSIRYK
jgi:hypothetical protein